MNDEVLDEVLEEKPTQSRPTKGRKKKLPQTVDMVEMIKMAGQMSGFEVATAEDGALKLTNSNGLPTKKAERTGSAAKTNAFFINLQAVRAHSDINNIDSLYECFEAYLKMCTIYGQKISNQAAYFACGVSPQLVKSWRLRQSRASDPRYAKFAEDILAYCSAIREQYGVQGETNNILTMFHQKVYDNFNDAPKPEETVAVSSSEHEDAETIAKKYANIPID